MELYSIMKNLFKNSIKVISILILILVSIAFFQIIGLFLWHQYEYYTYRYVIMEKYNSIFDKKKQIELIDKGQSLLKEDGTYYAYKKGIYIIFSDDNDDIYLYLHEMEYQNSYKIELIKNKYNTIIFKSLEEMPYKIRYNYEYLKSHNNTYKSQGAF